MCFDEAALPLSPIYLAGPTASGKSRLAIALAQHLNGEIVNADAFQLYQGIPICSAQPSTEDLATLPHHLYGILNMAETCDAARYASLAQPVIEDVLSRGKVPIITGGSGLYIKALTHGLSQLPSDPNLRNELALLTGEQRVQQLLALDPAAEQTVNLRNDRYVSRALEICLLTGQPQSSLRKSWAESDITFRGIVLQWESETLSERILQRTHLMLDAGLINEVQNLPPDTSVTAEKAIGVKQVRAYLHGDASLEQTIEAIHFSTRQYARRQRTWFRREKSFTPLPITPAMTSADIDQAALEILHSHS